jgi:flagellar biosynthesis protein FliP
VVVVVVVVVMMMTTMMMMMTHFSSFITVFANSKEPMASKY